MRYLLASASAVALALFTGAANALPQAVLPGGDPCVAGAGLYRPNSATPWSCLPCASLNRANGAQAGTCGSCNVANSALDATTNACLCAGTDKGRIDGKCLPCGVNGFANGSNRITCSPCRVGAAPDSTGACRCNSDKGLYLGAGTEAKCLMCTSLGRKNGARATSLTSYGDCGACIDGTKKPDATGTCVTPCAAGSGYLNGACAVCTGLNRGATGDGLTCSGCTITTATPNPTTGSCPAPIVPCAINSGYVNGACAVCTGLNRGATGDGLTCSGCTVTTATPDATTGACPAPVVGTPLNTELLINRSFETRVNNEPVSWVEMAEADEAEIYYGIQATGGSAHGSFAFYFAGERPGSICQNIVVSSPGIATFSFYAAVAGEEDMAALRQGSFKAAVRLTNPGIDYPYVFLSPELKNDVPFTEFGTWNYGFFTYDIQVPAAALTICIQAYNPSSAPYLADDLSFKMTDFQLVAA